MKVRCQITAFDKSGKVLFGEIFDSDKPFPLCDRFIDTYNSLINLFGKDIEIRYIVQHNIVENEDK